MFVENYNRYSSILGPTILTMHKIKAGLVEMNSSLYMVYNKQVFGPTGARTTRYHKVRNHQVNDSTPCFIEFPLTNLIQSSIKHHMHAYYNIKIKLYNKKIVSSGH